MSIQHADAANKLTGISSFANSIRAGKRWALSYITHTLENSFENSMVKENLYNITTGKSALKKAK